MEKLRKVSCAVCSKLYAWAKVAVVYSKVASVKGYQLAMILVNKAIKAYVAWKLKNKGK